jgi:predicted GTPase/uncharacterized protein (DUF697 family)
MLADVKHKELYVNFDNAKDDLEHIAKYMKMHGAKTLNEMDPVNIMVCGSSGVGKSTLINAMFGKQLAATRKGEPVTTNIERFTDPSLPLCLYDTRGLEITNSASTISALQQFVEGLRGQLDASSQLHVVWLCLLESSNRIEAAHKDLLALFASYEIPVIVVMTQAQGNDEFVELARRLAVPAAAVVPVMAQTLKTKIGTYEVENLDALVNETLRVLPEARQKAFEYCQKADWKRKIKHATTAVNVACVAAGATAPIPIPGGHSAALIVIDTAMLLQINAALGVSTEEQEGKSVAVGLLGIVGASVGGKMAFAELIKFIPGIGSVGGAVIGAAVAVPVTKMLGTLYIDVVSELVKQGEHLPKADALIGLLKAAFEARKSYYIDVGKRR